MDIANLIVDAIGTIALPAVIFLVSKQATDALKNREINTKYVELAIKILTEGTIEKDKDLEKWAREVMKQYSPVPLSDDIIVKLRAANLSVTPGSD